MLELLQLNKILKKMSNQELMFTILGTERIKDITEEMIVSNNCLKNDAKNIYIPKLFQMWI